MIDFSEIKSEKQEEDLKDNGITSPPSLRSVVKKSYKSKFIRTAGFVCKYPYRVSHDKGDKFRLGSMVKEIDFWYGEQVQSMRLDANASKGSQKKYKRHLVYH